MTPQQAGHARPAGDGARPRPGGGAWADRVTAASTVNIPSARRHETMARRRAEGGPADAPSAPAGLELRPRRCARPPRSALRGRAARITERDSLGNPQPPPTKRTSTTPRLRGARGLLTASDEEMDAALEKLLAGG
ncbi:hypothetical protein QJS66_22495 [Kocuria rhizophila]|nr:hypothetical protein QJS66_22495 [Kocuria rhizophila]